jgi:putative ABC transport system permease protein
MKFKDVTFTAVGNTFRSKARTILTVLAIFIGAFTLTITSGLGTGINRYIEDTVSTFGSSDVMTITKASEQDPAEASEGPAEYDPDRVSGGVQPGAPPGTTFTVMTQDDIDTIAGIDGVLQVEPTRSTTLDYIQYDDGTQFIAEVNSLPGIQTPQLTTGEPPDDTAEESQMVLPVSYVESLGFTTDDQAVGATVTIALTDAAHRQQTIDAEIVGVAEASFSPTGTDSIFLNDFLATTLYDVQNVGLPEDQQGRYLQASVWFDATATDQEIDALQQRLTDVGYDSMTLADQLGVFTTVIDAIVLVLNAFAVIALLAASFGIVNTLLMSVQERTREIGLMKAMGMSSGRVFTLFSLEASFIGFLGSAIGALIAVGVGSVVSSILADGFLSALPGLTLIAFDPATILTTILIIMIVGFLAGTIPAIRAAKKDPVDALRYE